MISSSVYLSFSTFMKTLDAVAQYIYSILLDDRALMNILSILMVFT